MIQYEVIKFFNKQKIDYNLSSAGKELVTHCLWNNENKRHLSVNTTTGLFQCFACGQVGNFSDIVFKIREKKRSGTLDISEFESDRKVIKPTRIVGKVIPYPEGHYLIDVNSPGQLGTEAKKYLNDRNITDSQITYYRLGFCISGRYSRRIIVPVLGQEQELLSFVARDYTGKSDKKILAATAESGTHGVKDYVYNLHNAAKTEHLLIAEGVFSAMSLGSRGVALFGKKASDQQIALIMLAKPKRITICLDPDAYDKSLALARQLANHFNDIRVASFPEGEDPNSLDKSLLDSCISKATRASDTMYSLEI